MSLELKNFSTHSESSSSSTDTSTAVSDQRMTGDAGKQDTTTQVHAVFFPQQYSPNVDWHVWLEMMEMYLLSKSITNGEQKKMILLQAVGVETLSRLMKWCVPKKPSDKTYDELVALLEIKFAKTTNKYVARVKLFNEKQLPHQSEQAFIAHMTEIAGNCQFDKMANPHEENTVLAILRGLKDTALREYLMIPTNDITTVDKLQALAIQFMQNRKSAKDITAAEKFDKRPDLMDLQANENDFNSLSIEQSCSISEIISNIKSKFGPANFTNQNDIDNCPTSIHNYHICYDATCNTPYIEADIHYDSLDTGAAEPLQIFREHLTKLSAPGDDLYLLIPKSLGGDGHLGNVYPINAKLDLTVLEEAQAMVYEHVKKNGNRTARLQFGLTFEDENDEKAKYFWRPKIIYFKFVLFENGNICGNIEGKVENDLPELQDLPKIYQSMFLPIHQPQ